MYRLKAIFFVITACLAMLVYWLTICPTVELIDSGELALACKYLGIAHPTGYPLYTLLGRIAAMILPGALIMRLNFLSLLFTSFAGGILYLIIVSLNIEKRLKGPQLYASAASIALFTSFTTVWWSQGTTNEVYSLNLLLICISLLYLVKYLQGAGNTGRHLLFSIYALGLSLTNHLSAVYLIPGFAVILINELWKKRIMWRLLLWLCIVFIFPLSLYIFLPVRASFSPFLNWGGVNDPYFLYKHISGWQYRVWMFADAGFGAVIERLEYSAALMLHQFRWFGLVLGIVGLFHIFVRKKVFAVFSILIILFNLLYAANYQIADIDSYYLPMIIIVAIFMSAGLLYLLDLATSSRRFNGLPTSIIVAVILFIIPLFNLFDNYFESDRSHRTFARRAIHDILKSMEPGGLAVMENWDFYSPWLYFHFEENYQPDKILLDKELMRRSWYIDFIRREHPNIYSRSDVQIGEFLKQVEPFERDFPFDPGVIDRAYYDMFGAIIGNESRIRPVYTNVVGDQAFSRLYGSVPDGILFRIYGSDKFLERPRFEFDPSFWGNDSVYRGARIGHILSYYGRAFASREKYCLYFGRNDEAEFYRQEAREVSSIIANIDK